MYELGAAVQLPVKLKRSTGGALQCAALTVPTGPQGGGGGGVREQTFYFGREDQ